jgi:rRNA maturation endonuclease Nob1
MAPRNTALEAQVADLIRANQELQNAVSWQTRCIGICAVASVQSALSCPGCGSEPGDSICCLRLSTAY